MLHSVCPQMDVLEALLQRKLKHPLDDALNSEFLSESITYFATQGTDCMWCKQPLITAELLWLFSLKDSEHLEWFKQVTTKCLQQCRPCIESYYKQKSQIIDRFRSIYAPNTLNIFIESIKQFDVHRLSLPLLALQQGTLQYKSPAVMFSLFEILLCPRWIKSLELGTLFERVLVNLIHTKRMLRVTENLPGVVLCAFHSNDTLRKWASTTLSGTVKTEGNIIDEEYEWRDILTCYCALLKLGTVTKDALLQSLALAVWWTPQQLIVSSGIEEWPSMIIEELNNTNNFVPAMHVLFACTSRSELCAKFRTALERAIVAALNSSIYWPTLNDEALSPTPSTILPDTSPRTVLVDWTLYLMTPAIFTLICSRIKQVLSKCPAACLTLLLTLVRKCTLNCAQLETVSSLVSSVPSKQNMPFDCASCKRDIMKVVFEKVVHSEAASTKLSVESARPALFFSVFALVPISEHPVEQVVQLCQVFLNAMKAGTPPLTSSLWLERESLMGVLRARLFVERPSKFSIEFALITSTLLNHFGELDDKQVAFLKTNSPYLCSALTVLINLVFDQSLLKKVIEQASLWTKLFKVINGGHLKFDKESCSAIGNLFIALLYTCNDVKLLNESRILFNRHNDTCAVFLSDILRQEHKSLDDTLARTLVLPVDFSVPMIKLLLKEMAVIKHKGDFTALKKLVETRSIDYKAIQDEVEAYERAMSIDLNLCSSPCTFANFFTKKDFNFEAEFMKRLVEQKQQQSVAKSAPSTSGSKLSQLRADVARDAVASKSSARVIKPVIKAPKMMLDHQLCAIASSSSPLNPVMKCMA